MNHPVLALVVLAAASLPVASYAQETFSDPKALVTAIFSAYQPGSPKGDPTIYYSKRLKTISEQALEDKVFTSDAAMSGSVFKPVQVFNPFLPDDNALLFDLNIGEPVEMDNRAVVTVRYHNFDAPRLLSISLIKDGDDWKVDDVASLGEQPWLLSWALMNDPYAM